MTIGFSAQFI